jgi:hypothetical protein
MKEVFILAPEFDIKSGGSVVLHKLMSLLSPLTRVHHVPTVAECIDNKLGSWSLFPKAGLTFDNKKIQKSVVVYPETLYGNPLNHPYPCRWILNTPGLICESCIDFNNESIYAYLPEFCDKPNQRLKITYFPDSLTARTAQKKYHHACFLIKKGPKYHSNKFHYPKNWVNIDNLTFEQQIDVISKSEYFISYDPYTMLSNFAPLFKTKSVVVEAKGHSQRSLYGETKLCFTYGNNICDSEFQTSQALNLFESLAYETCSDFLNFVTCEITENHDDEERAVSYVGHVLKSEAGLIHKFRSRALEND